MSHWPNNSRACHSHQGLLTKACFGVLRAARTPRSQGSSVATGQGNAFDDAAEQTNKVVKQTGKEAKQATEATKEAAADVQDAAKKAAEDVTP